LFVNPLNAELNPICHLLTLLGAHPILHVSRIRVKPVSCLTLNPLVCEVMLKVTTYSALLCYFQGLKAVFDALVIAMVKSAYKQLPDCIVFSHISVRKSSLVLYEWLF